MSKGTKNDGLKPDLSLIPTDALWGMGAALTYGAKKYSRHNFRNGLQYSRLIAATMRHLSAFNEGADLDDESLLPHLDHALASLAMLKFMTIHKRDMDDRWSPNMKTPKTDILPPFGLGMPFATEDEYNKFMKAKEESDKEIRKVLDGY